MRPNILVYLLVAALLSVSCAGGAGTTATPPQQSSVSAAGPAPGTIGIPKRYAVTDLGTTVEGAHGITPTAVNNSGEVVGGISTTLSIESQRRIFTAPPAWVFRGGSLHALPVPTGYDVAFSYDINDSGAISGSALRRNPFSLPAIVWMPNGQIINLGTSGLPVAGLPSNSAEAYSISDTGIIVGQGGNTGAGEFQPLIFNGPHGPYNPCGEYDGFTVQGRLLAVNNSGVATGSLERGSASRMMTCPPFSIITPPAPNNSDLAYADSAYGINDAGDVVGWFFASSLIRHAFLNRRGIATDLGTLFPGDPLAESVAFAINNTGVVVGFSFEAFTLAGIVNPRAFVYANGAMVDLNTLLPPECANWTVVQATDISEDGKISAIVFVGGYPNGKQHGVLLTPAR